MRPLIEQLRSHGLSFRAIARELNRRGVRTLRGKQWHGDVVKGALVVPQRVPHRYGAGNQQGLTSGRFDSLARAMKSQAHRGVVAPSSHRIVLGDARNLSFTP